MLEKRFCVASIVYAMMSMAGIATPFVHAAEAGQLKPADAATTTAVADDDAAKPAPAATDTSVQTKVVVSQKQIEEGNQQDGYGEAVKTVAGVASNNGAGSANNSVKFRGIQLGLYTNYRINGGLAITNVITIPTEDKQRVEALKGANALMFGLASPAGIINMVTKRAAPKDLATLTVSGNAFGQYGAAVDLSRKFGDEQQFGVRLNASGTHVATGVRTLTGNGEFASVAADWQASRKLSFKLDLEDYRKDVAEQGAIAPLAAVNNVIVVPHVPDATRMLGVTWGIYTPRTVNKILRTDYVLSDDWRVLAEVGASNSERSRVQVRTTGKYDVVTGAATMQIQWIKDQHYDNSFARVELDGRFALASIRNEAAFGYSSTERKANNPFGFASVNVASNIYNPAPLAEVADPNKAISYAPSNNKEDSLYFYDTVSLTDTFKVLAGVRKAKASFSSTNQKTFVVNKLDSTPSAPGLGWLWEVAPATVLYGSFMRAFEDGPTATAGTVNEFQILAPTESTQKEIGIRTDALRGVHANIDYFDIVRANAVANSVAGAHFNEFLIDGTSHLRGFEIAASAALGKAWSVDGTAQLMRGTQRTVINPALNDKTPENMAEVIGTFNVAYKPAAIAGLTLKAGASYTGPRFINALDQGKIPGVTLFSAGAALQTRIAGHATSFQVSLTNLANKSYWNSVTSTSYGAGMDRAIQFSLKTAY